MNTENMYNRKSDTNPNKSLYITLIIGVCLIIFAIYLYFDLAAWEKSNETMHMHAFLWFLYDIGGKLVVSGFFTFIGGMLIFLGIKKSKELRELKEQSKNY